MTIATLQNRANQMDLITFSRSLTASEYREISFFNGSITRFHDENKGADHICSHCGRRIYEAGQRCSNGGICRPIAWSNN